MASTGVIDIALLLLNLPPIFAAILNDEPHVSGAG
nr:MetaGeneMark_Unknown Function [uncultured bacterium]